jgi:hypothetical protein
MMRRSIVLPAILAGLVVVGSVVIVINLANGNYGRVGAQATADVTSFKQLGAGVAAIRKLKNVARVEYSFNPVHLPEPTASMAVVMKSGAVSDNLLAVADFVADSATANHVGAGTLTLHLKSRNLSVTETTFQPGDPTLGEQLTVWSAMQSSDGPQLTASIATTNGTGIPASTLTVQTRSGAASDIASVVQSYPASLAKLAGKPAGPVWNLPGMSGVGSLPPVDVLRLLASTATEFPISDRRGNRVSSGVHLDTGGASPVVTNLFLGYFGKSGQTLDPTLHLTDASKLAHEVARANAANVNFDYYGLSKGALVNYRFFAHTCDGKINAAGENRDTLAMFGLTPRDLNGGSAGACSPR